jgi:hypothetical protein
MECDDFGVALVVRPEGESCASRNALSLERFLTNSSHSLEKDYQSDAEVVALHSRCRERSLHSVDSFSTAPI